jgi:hypothetical protein
MPKITHAVSVGRILTRIAPRGDGVTTADLPKIDQDAKLSAQAVYAAAEAMGAAETARQRIRAVKGKQFGDLRENPAATKVVAPRKGEDRKLHQVARYLKVNNAFDRAADAEVVSVPSSKQPTAQQRRSEAARGRAAQRQQDLATASATHALTQG